jgi:hypothetical protein
VRPTDELEVIKANLQSRLRSGVGMLLYSIKHSRLDIANVVKYMDDATLAAYKDILQVIRFVYDTQLFCEKMEPKKDEDWNLLFIY